MNFKQIFKPIVKAIFNWIFNYIDKNKDGVLSKEEISEFVDKFNSLKSSLKKK